MTPAIELQKGNRLLRILTTPVLIDARPLILAVLFLTCWSFKDSALSKSTSDRNLPKVETPVVDTVRVQVPDDSLTRYILAQMEAVEDKFRKPSAMAANNKNPFEVALFELFRREGYVPNVYRCPAGLETVGFGDVIDTEAEQCFRNGMPFSVARAKVYANLKTGGDEIQRRFPGKYPGAPEWLALCLLGHSVGWERLEKKYPAFYREIAEGKPTARWLKYCRYIDGRTKKVKRSTNLARTRTVEWLLFNRDFAGLTAYHDDAAKIAAIRYTKGRAESLQRFGVE